MAAPSGAAPNAAILRSKLASMQQVISSLDNPRARLRETWPATMTPETFHNEWKGSLVKMGPAAAGGVQEWAVIQFEREAGGEISVRVGGAAPVAIDRATLVGRSVQVAKGCLSKDDGTVADAGVRAGAISRGRSLRSEGTKPWRRLAWYSGRTSG